MAKRLPKTPEKPKPKSKPKRAIAKRCSASTAEGRSCLRAVRNDQDLCYAHRPPEVDPPVKLTPKTDVSGGQLPEANGQDQPLSTVIGHYEPLSPPASWIPIVLGQARAGATVADAARAAGIERQAIYQHAADWPEFDAEWMKARAIGERLRTDDLEDRLYVSLTQNSVKRTVMSAGEDGTKTIVERKFDARSAIAHLKVKKAAKPLERNEAVTVVLMDDDGKDDDA